jgi:hypothetical protein
MFCCFGRDSSLTSEPFVATNISGYKLNRRHTLTWRAEFPIVNLYGTECAEINYPR